MLIHLLYGIAVLRDVARRCTAVRYAGALVADGMNANCLRSESDAFDDFHIIHSLIGSGIGGIHFTDATFHLGD